MNRIVRYTFPRTASQLSQLGLRHPWSGLESEVNRLFESALADVAAPLAPRFPVDLYEDKDNHYVRAELPGIAREAIAIEMVDGYLTINATRQNGDETLSFNRSVSIPEAVQADKVVANYEHGVLTVTLPKQEQAKPRKISIAVN